MRSYSSLTALLADYRTLGAADGVAAGPQGDTARSCADRAALAAIDAALAEMPPAERAALGLARGVAEGAAEAAAPSATARRRERAERRLRHLLTRRALLTG